MSSSNKISQQIEEYIIFKQSLGYELTRAAEALRKFASFTRDKGFEKSLSVDIAMQWISLNQDSSRKSKARKLETIHSFAVYAASCDSAAQIPPPGVFGKSHQRVNPYIYSEKEILCLMDEAGKLFSQPDGIRCQTVATALGLLWSTGLRVSELTNLLVRDVCLSQCFITVRSTKFKKDRIVYFHETVAEELSRYDTFLRNKSLLRTEDDYFFVSTCGRRFNIRAFEYAFILIRPCLLSDGQTGWIRRKPRLADMRHSFACNTIFRWLQNEENVNHNIFLLSLYMGHVKPEDTYWYLTATPQLLAMACTNFEPSADWWEGAKL